MINSITVPKGTKVEYTVSREGFIPSSDIITINEDKLIVVTLERKPDYGNYWTIWDGGGQVELYRDFSSQVEASPVKKEDLSFNPDRMRFPSTTTSVTYIDGSTLTSTYRMFWRCSALTSVPAFDTSNVTDMRGMFRTCSSLTSVPALDTSNVTIAGYMFEGCSSLTSVPALDTRNVTNMEDMFSNCSRLTSISRLNMSNVTGSTVWTFYDCSALENITLEGSLNVGVSFSSCKNLTYDSILSILTAAANTGNLDSKTLYFKRTIEDQDDELATLVTVCTAHGWTIIGLTLK